MKNRPIEPVDLERCSITFRGVVQGVGFRPAVARLASSSGITGWICNTAGTVTAVFEGSRDSVRNFLAGLKVSLPPNAAVESMLVTERKTISASERAPYFQIIESSPDNQPEPSIPPDLAVCPDCRREITDPADRRYRYAFTTCTACGPRYTVLKSMPYDRRQTTMDKFHLCRDCASEYNNPSDRRFHAETTACPACGPKLILKQLSGAAIPGDPLINTRRLLAAGKIVAVRGIGGFLLTCDAFNRTAIETLRSRKYRPHKPLAVMAANLSVIRKYCRTSPQSEKLLDSSAAPIVILDPADSKAMPIDLISPDTGTTGMMLPSSPLHLLLFEQAPGDPVPPFELLIMTSGNRRSEPICLSDPEAEERLRDIADAFLTHDRDITLRNDDSLCAMMGTTPQVWRRARGYAPAPIRLDWQLRKTVLAMGAEIKNTVAVGYENRVAISPHIGDLETPEAIDGMLKVAHSLPEFLGRKPDVVAVDLNPDMHSTAEGRKIAEQSNVEALEVQHHHAHGAACLAEHGLQDGLALIFDGTGLGPDGTIWGAELMDINAGGFRRLATFSPAPLPGGDAAVLHPARQAVARLAAAGITPKPDLIRKTGASSEEASLWTEQIRKQVNTPMTHAAGRVFDAFSAILGSAPTRITYEGQPAIRLENLAAGYRGKTPAPLPVAWKEENGILHADWAPAFLEISATDTRGREKEFAMAVHTAIAQAAFRMVEYGLSFVTARYVALSGGVFMNRILNALLVPMLEKTGIRALVHGKTPPNDGCISFGQAVIAGR